MICISFLEGWTLRIPWLNHKWFRHHRWGTNSDSDVRWTAAQQPGLADGRPAFTYVRGPRQQDVGEALKQAEGIEPMKVLICEYRECTWMKMHPFVYMIHAHRSWSEWCVSMYELYMDHDWSNSWAWTSHHLQGIGSRRLKTSPGICHAFWESNRNVDQRWFRFNWLLLEPDRFLTATVLCRRLGLFCSLTLEISPLSPDALPDPFLPDDVRAGCFLNMHLPCQCTISTDGVFESISKIRNDTKTEPNEIDT